MKKVNFHTHSQYCDGKGTLRQYVGYAIQHGFSHLGFSGHAPVPFQNTFAIPQDQYADYCREVRALQAEFEGKLNISLGLEIDYIPGVQDDFEPLKKEGNLDYCIGGIHFVNRPDNPFDLWFIDGSKQETYDEGFHRLFGDDIRSAVRAFFLHTNRMITEQKFNIIAHFDKIVMHNRNRYFTYDEPWFRDLVFETVELIAERGIIAEVNTRGLYKKRHTDFYPATQTLRFMNEKHIPVLVGTDAHQPENLDQFEGAYELLHNMEYKNIAFSPWG